MTRPIGVAFSLVLALAMATAAFGGPAPAAPAPTGAAATAAPAVQAPPAPASPAATATPAPAAAQAPAPKVGATVKTVTGTVETRPSVDQPWAPVKVGQPLAEGADLRTGFRANCILEMDQSTLKVDPLTVLRIGELHREGDTIRTRVYMKQGNAAAAVQKAGAKNDFAIVTPSATLSVRGTHEIQCRFFAIFGGRYGLTEAGLLAIINNIIGNAKNVHPGEQTNDDVPYPIIYLTWLYLPQILDFYGFEGPEREAAMRWHASTFVPPGIGGPQGPPFFSALDHGQGFQPPAPATSQSSYYP